MLDTLCSGMSHSTVDCEFSVSESTTYILNKVPLSRNTHKTRLLIDWLTKIL